MRIRTFGKMGDIVYAMSMIRRASEAEGAPIDVSVGGMHSEFIPPNILFPLLQSQNYIGNVALDNADNVDVDLTELEMDRDANRNIMIDITEFAQETIDLADIPPTSPWLNVAPTPASPQIVVNWTGRYLTDDWTENAEVQGRWIELMKQYPNAVFIGLENEQKEFAEWTDLEIEYHPTQNLLEAAGLISGCELFLGNQSACLAIAHGLGKTVAVESSNGYPNCTFIGRGSQYFGISAELVETYGIPCQ